MLAGASSSSSSATTVGGHQQSSRAVLEVPSLTRMCVKSVALNIGLWCQGVEEFHLERCRYILTAFDEYALPDHLALQILNQLALRRKITLSNFVMFLNPSLAQLDLHECGGFITDHFLRQVAKRALRIRHLNLATCFKITNAAVLDLARHLRCLRSVDLGGCNKIQDNAIQAIAENTGITSLKLLAVHKLGDGALLRVSACLPNLQELDLTNCPRVTDQSAVQLFDLCPKLRTLDLCGCWEISDVAFSHIKQQTNLEHLDVAVSSIGDVGVHAIKETCKMIKFLNLEGCSGITDNAFIDGTAFGEHLESLNLAGCSNITEHGLLSLFLDQITCPENLRVLHLPQTLTDNAFIFITDRLRHLVTLNMECCKKITDKSFKSYPLISLHEVREMPRNQRYQEIIRMSDEIDEGEIPGDHCFPLRERLKKLNCKGCEMISDLALACLAFQSEEEPKDCALEEVVLEGCALITDEGLRQLKNCSNLRALDLSKCTRITSSGVEDLLQGKPDDSNKSVENTIPQTKGKDNNKKQRNKNASKSTEESLLVDEEGELPWALVGGSQRALANQILAQQQRKRSTNRRKKKRGIGRTNIAHMKLGGCSHITHFDWEYFKQQFPSVMISWN